MNNAMFTALVATLAMSMLSQPASAQGGTSGGTPIAHGLLLPHMDPVAGRKLFGSKGCVVCHSINGIGGQDAAPLDASTMANPMNPFDFSAKMWRGAEPMVAMQKEELGGQIDLTGDDLANIIAFVHDPQEQAKFSKADIPDNIARLMSKDRGGSMGGGHMPGMIEPLRVCRRLFGLLQAARGRVLAWS
ncbi:MAG: hypothetical protein BGO51_00090 [Rhodospirillales bacterium 69-11]|nr:MAG: hypothetical protein BGO51_00090 [Rhodospirillales bacterium 69-11]